MPHLSQAFSELMNLSRRKRVLANVIWVLTSIPAGLLCCVLQLPFALACVVIPLAGAPLALWLLARQEKQLTARHGASDGGPLWIVQINGVHVGHMTDAQYAGIRSEVIFDARLYVAQACNLAATAGRVVDYLLRSIPLAVFWGGIGLCFWAPETFAELLTAGEKLTTDQVASLMPPLLFITVWASVLSVLAQLAMGRRFGFIDHFDQACGKRVRLAMACAIDGAVSLHQLAAGSLVASEPLSAPPTNR